MRILQTMVSGIPPTYWALEPECEILLFTWPFRSRDSDRIHKDLPVLPLESYKALEPREGEPRQPNKDY